MLDLVLITAGLVLLTFGGEVLIRGALAAARKLGVSPLLSGLLIVGFGTSAPEMVVSVDAAMHSLPDIAVGNVVGSNIGNILLILGLCALIAPMSVKPLVLRRDAVTVVVASLLFILLVSDRVLGKFDATLLFGALVIYLSWAYWTERFHAAPSVELHQAEEEELSLLPKAAWQISAAILLGLVSLIGGSKIFLSGAVGIAQAFGLSEAVIGLTLVAVGTSLPELSVSVIAAFRRHADVAIGNILGSNIFNLLGIMSMSAMLQPLPIHSRVIHFDQWIMLGAAMLLLVFLNTERRLSRVEGGILLLGYGVYLALSFDVYRT